MLGVSLALYLIGSIPFAIISSKIFSLPDPRSFGSKNPGATNVMRSGNIYAAAITLVGDALKGLLPVILLLNMGVENYHVYLLSFFILLGHTFPITLKFKGGKGVATSIGILLSLDIIVASLVILTWLVIYFLFKVSDKIIFSFSLLVFIFIFILIKLKNLFRNHKFFLHLDYQF